MKSSLMHARISALVLLASLTACPSAGDTARQKALLPAMRMAWTNVKLDLERGIPPVPEQIAVLSGALDTGTTAAFKRALADWPTAAAAANAGFDARIAAGELTTGTAESLRERLRNFGESISVMVNER
jgi:hypothetical protein